MTVRFSVVPLFFFFFSLQPGNAQQIVVPLHVQIPLLLKVVSLEKNISSREETYTIGIIFQQSYKASEEVKDQILATNREEELLLLDGTPVDFIPLEIDSKKDIARIFSGQKFDAVYISPLRSVDIKMLTAYTEDNDVLSMTGVPDYVDEGISVGIGIEGEEPTVIINLESSSEEGVEFSSKVLSLARIVR